MALERVLYAVVLTSPDAGFVAELHVVVFAAPRVVDSALHVVDFGPGVVGSAVPQAADAAPVHVTAFVALPVVDSGLCAPGFVLRAAALAALRVAVFAVHRVADSDPRCVVPGYAELHHVAHVVHVRSPGLSAHFRYYDRGYFYPV